MEKIKFNEGSNPLKIMLAKKISVNRFLYALVQLLKMYLRRHNCSLNELRLFKEMLSR